MNIFDIVDDLPIGPGREALYKLCCAIDELRGTGGPEAEKIGSIGLGVRFGSIQKHIRSASVELDRYHDALVDLL